MGRADGGAVGHRVMLDQLVVDFLGIDIHPAGDDRLSIAAGEEQVVVLIEIPDIAHGEKAVHAAGIGLGLVLVIGEAAYRG